MRKISELIASFSAVPDPILGLEQAQTELESARRAVDAELAAMPAAHLAALEDDDTALLATLRQRRPVLEDESARLALAVQKIGEKIKDERAAAKARRASEFGVQHDNAVAGYLQNAKPAMASFDAILTVRATAIREGFANVMAAKELPPNLNGHGVLAFDLLEKFEKQQKPVPAAPRRTPPPPRKIASPPPRMTDSQGMVRLGEMPVQRHERRAPLREVPNAGEVAVSILRSGVDMPGRPLLAVGDVISLPKDSARTLVLSGAADYVDYADACPPKVLNVESETESAKESRA